MTGRLSIARGRAGRIGGVAVLLLSAALTLTAGAGTPVAPVAPVAPVTQDKGKQKGKPRQAFALLAGTVFDENGRRVPEAEIRVREKEGKRHWDTATDAQGEFAVRLPAGAAVYVVGATRRGFSSDSKEVTFGGDERVDISMNIARAGARRSP